MVSRGWCPSSSIGLTHMYIMDADSAWLRIIMQRNVIAHMCVRADKRCVRSKFTFEVGAFHLKIFFLCC